MRNPVEFFLQKMSHPKDEELISLKKKVKKKRGEWQANSTSLNQNTIHLGITAMKEKRNNSRRNKTHKNYVEITHLACVHKNDNILVYDTEGVTKDGRK